MALQDTEFENNMKIIKKYENSVAYPSFVAHPKILSETPKQASSKMSQYYTISYTRFPIDSQSIPNTRFPIDIFRCPFHFILQNNIQKMLNLVVCPKKVLSLVFALHLVGIF